MIAGLRTGDSVVMTDFFRRYGPSLEKIAAGRIDGGMRRRVGPETIAQSVCRTFLRRAQDDQFALGDPGRQMMFMAKTLHDEQAVNDLVAYINSL